MKRPHGWPNRWPRDVRHQEAPLDPHLDQEPGPVMLVIGLPDPDEILLSLIEAHPHVRDEDVFRKINSMRNSIHRSRSSGYSETRAFPDVRWMEISSLLQREQAAGRRPEQIRQIEFVGESLDMASVLQWRRKILAAAEAAP